MKIISSVDFVLEEIIKIRSLDSGDLSKCKQLCPEKKKLWYDLFTAAFLTGREEYFTEPCTEDDLVFFVDCSLGKENKPTLRVLRRCSPNTPKLQDALICWEKSVYLNLIMNSIAYVITVGICTRSGANEIEILNKISHKVYASPTHRRMDCKGNSAVTVYPHIVFHVDNFGEVFENVCLRDSECLCVELTAFDHLGVLLGVIFEGVVRYSTLKYSHEFQISGCPGKSFSRRRCSPLRISSLLDRNVISSKSFLRIFSHQSQCNAEVAVWSQLNNRASCNLHHDNDLEASPQEPAHNRFSENNVNIFSENSIQRHISSASKRNNCRSLSLNASPEHKRICDSCSKTELCPTSLNSPSALFGGNISSEKEAREYVPSEIAKHFFESVGFSQPPKKVPKSSLSAKNSLNHFNKKARSDSGYLNTMPDFFQGNSRNCFDIHASSFDDVFDDLLPEFSKNEDVEQAWNWLKQRRRIISPVLNVALTYIQMPWSLIISGISEVRKSPVLTLASIK